MCNICKSLSKEITKLHYKTNPTNILLYELPHIHRKVLTPGIMAPTPSQYPHHTKKSSTKNTHTHARHKRRTTTSQTHDVYHLMTFRDDDTSGIWMKNNITSLFTDQVVSISFRRGGQQSRVDRLAGISHASELCKYSVDHHIGGFCVTHGGTYESLPFVFGWG